LQAAEARKEREFAEGLYYGTVNRGYEQGSLAEEMPNLNVSLQEFKHLSSIIGAHQPPGMHRKCCRLGNCI
jgi:hypothetical protein